MTDKEKIIAEIERRIHFLDGMINTDFGRGSLDTLNKVLDFINSIPAKHTSEDVEEAANIYANKQGLELKPFAIKFFKSGADWQKEQMMKKVL